MRLLYELRSYDLKVGQAPNYLEMFRTKGLEFVTRHLPMAGYWLTDTGALNRIYHMWIYESLEERASCRAGLAGDKDWNESFVPLAFPLIVAQQNFILKCTKSSLLLEETTARRADHHINQAAALPMFTQAPLSLTFALTFGAPNMADECLGQWRVVSGEQPQAQVSLFRHPSGDPFVTAKGSDRHEVLRALSCSPLQ